ncbi:MAG: hypothetical protein MZU97_20360 [Bacillus subtilis]|nr:hypothetical protein [Bacillus subtilis]
MSGFYRPHVKDTGKAALTLLATAAFAITLNKILGVTDFMTLEYGNGNPFQPLLLTELSALFVAASVRLRLAERH